METEYIDRWGETCIPQKRSVIHPRSGAWFVLIANDSLLLTHPNYAPDVPDLPGGGIDDGETAIEAACRELKEETVLDISSEVLIDSEYKQYVPFYADDLSEYWDYDQTFFLVTDGIDHLFFQGKREVPEGYSEWIKINYLNDYQIHHMHKKALKFFGLV